MALPSYPTYNDSPCQIWVGDAQTIPSLGEGTVSITCIVNSKPVSCHIQDVQYVPNLTYGLISCFVLNCRGLGAHFKDGVCKVHDKQGCVIAETVRDGSLYYLNMKASPSLMPHTSINADTDTAFVILPSFDLVHKWLAHPGKDTLQQMIHNNLVNGLTDVPDDSKNFDCIACICGKMTWGPFQDGHPIACKRLGYLHSDICGLLEYPLWVNNTGYLWYHPCFAKSDFTPWFIKMDSLFLNHYQSCTKILRSD